MLTIGLIGGIGWQSTIEYYRIINERVVERTQGRHAARILLDSLDYGDVERFHRNDDMAGLTTMVVSSARRLENAGAQCLLICANTMHVIAPDVVKNITIPLIHIVDVTLREIMKKNLRKVGLLGTKFTMEHDFYKERLAAGGIETIVPDAGARDFIQRVIFTELFRAFLNPESKAAMLEIIGDLARKGAEGIILGCTEIPLLIRPGDCDIPVFDTTEIHAMAAVEMALAHQ